MNELYALRINHREIVWNSKRESWLPVYADDREGPDGDESRADVCVHESEEAGKMVKKAKK